MAFEKMKITKIKAINNQIRISLDQQELLELWGSEGGLASEDIKQLKVQTMDKLIKEGRTEFSKSKPKFF